ncbi:sugar ABC transporter ATP-binding protein [Rhodoplanes sp. Z2-YC6860]|uniref:sugar ABC transporter ATP-binding protein n=1 Tax=Rhodoplanes sp. Z2-YC6860 TaxID=674703 RepID=UPI00078C5B69|nr:sugar ABC transporter ATP-binding protein [Rhodoplanes sp. Z2-YC6860]AMN45315.1 ribose ABC transporter ATP-binding protein RbsA [Rhodoplanes sp. Z2-YC6860]
MSTPAASAYGITKQFGATRALDHVDFDVMPGEIHALVGENGAGKSTLVRVLSGVHRPDQGEVAVDGKAHHFNSPHDAIAAGIAAIPQELRLVPALSVAENLTLDGPPVRRRLGIATVDRDAMREEARVALAALEFAPDPDVRVDQLSFAERQLVAIAKALRRRCRLLILDEPTAALETREIERLFALLARMKSQGTAIIYVSHRLDEVVALADRCTVLRDGQVVATSRRGSFAVRDLVQAMTGRAEAQIGDRGAAPGETILEDADQRTDAIRLRANEIVGLVGLLGSGTGRVLRRLYGLAAGGANVRVRGEARRLDLPIDAISLGVGMVPGERRLGLVMNLSVRDNILLPTLDRLTRGGSLDHFAGDRLVAELMEQLDVRPRNPSLPVRALSGGNQQKVILAKWLALNVGVLLLEEPTQGVDIVAKAQIHALLRKFANRGGAVLASSSDLAELTRLCDSICALRQQKITARFEAAQGFDERRLHAAIGG